VSDIAGPGTLVLTDGTATGSYTFQITNAGDTATGGQFANTVTILPGGSTFELGVIGNLEAGESIVLNRDLTFESVGEFTVQATADSGNDVDEITNVNNTATKVIVVSAAE
jgi:hypothetical protein